MIHKGETCSLRRYTFASYHQLPDNEAENDLDAYFRWIRYYINGSRNKQVLYKSSDKPDSLLPLGYNIESDENDETGRLTTDTSGQLKLPWIPHPSGDKLQLLFQGRNQLWCYVQIIRCKIMCRINAKIGRIFTIVEISRSSVLLRCSEYYD